MRNMSKISMHSYIFRLSIKHPRDLKHYTDLVADEGHGDDEFLREDDGRQSRPSQTAVLIVSI